jgi:hypothetical protein
MASKSKTPSAGDAEGHENVLLDSLNSLQDNLSERRAQYLAVIFTLPSDTACTIAALAFGEGQSCR